MKLLEHLRQLWPGKATAKEWTIEAISAFSSDKVGESFDLQVFLPPNYHKHNRHLPILFLNDGQDAEALALARTLKLSSQFDTISDFILVAIQAVDRMHTYGTSQVLDYKKRGSKAKAYGAFIVEELLPWLQLQYRVSHQAQAHTIAGFSLGGLSALDIVWNYPHIFGQVGVFSGSLWWRSQAFDPADPDANRIMHTLIAAGPKKEGLRFWFQTGTLDEKEDRNNNGVIDAIDDTLDLIKILRDLKYQAIEYVEVEGGEHNPQTWGKVFPQFLRWGFGR